MHFQCDQNLLAHGLSTVSRIIAGKTTLPVLSGVLLEVQENTLFLTATDLEISVRTSLPVSTVSEGSIVLPARQLVEIVRRFPAGPVFFKQQANSLTVDINCRYSNLSLNGMDAALFPSFPEIQFRDEYYFHFDDFRSAIRQVAIGMASDTTRPIFNGCLFEVEENGTATLVSTDTHRLCVRHLPFRSKTTHVARSVVIPGKVLTEISKIVDPDSDELTMGFSDNQIYLKTSRDIMICRLLEGKYPQYRQVLPHSFSNSITLKISDILPAVERAGLLVKEEQKLKGNVVRLKLKGHTLSIDSQSPEIGRIHEEIPIEQHQRELDVTYNVKYILDVLKVMETEKIIIDFSATNSAAIFRPYEGAHYMCLVLPIKQF